MIKVNKILCPTDFSEASYKALELACSYADHFGADLILAHVVEPIPAAVAGGPEPAMAFDISSYEKHLMEINEEHIKKVVDERTPDDINVKPMVVRGDPADEILKIAGEEEADLTVIAAKGHSMVRELLFGSTAEKVIKHSKNPVLTVRGEE
ncbi:MAG: universal stress protein [Candidatus Krumholzibacteriota bacterium]|nr:universal stress protein [Candidatus Krumholzibacteriota bacterium]